MALVDPRHAELIKSLRQEAADARGGFRTLTTQAIAFSVAAVSAILIAGEKAPESAFATIAVFFVINAVQRTGIHKFSTANRLNGYQLHMERLVGGPDIGLAELGWEEACRAWRIVQATIFKAVYVTPQGLLSWPLFSDLCPLFYRHQKHFRKPIRNFFHDCHAKRRQSYTSWSRCISEFLERIRNLMIWFMDFLETRLPGMGIRTGETPQADDTDLSRKSKAGGFKEDLPNFWWMQSLRAQHEEAFYHAGSYLERLFATLGMLQFFSLLPLAVLFAKRWHEPHELGRAGWLALICLPVFLLIWVGNWFSLRRRRILLEDEMLSIHSCAIMWKVVALAHYLAWGPDTESENRQKYTENLAIAARNLASDALTLRRLIDDKVNFAKVAGRKKSDQNGAVIQARDAGIASFGLGLSIPERAAGS